jgi:hypothetical protein
VGFEDGDLFFRRKTPPTDPVLLVGHIFRSALSANPNCGKVHFQLRQDIRLSREAKKIGFELVRMETPSPETANAV